MSECLAPASAGALAHQRRAQQPADRIRELSVGGVKLISSLFLLKQSLIPLPKVAGASISQKGVRSC